MKEKEGLSYYLGFKKKKKLNRMGEKNMGIDR
jgi:hypothetical protein